MGNWLKRTRSVNIVRQRSNKLKQTNKKQKNTLQKNIPSSTLWNLLTDLLCSKPPGNCAPHGFGRPSLIRAQKAALRTPGDKCRAPGLCLRPSGHLSPRATPCLAFESDLHHSPTGAKQGGRAPAVLGACSRSSGAEALS